MPTPSIDRNALLARAQGLGWPVVGCSGNIVANESQWRRLVPGAFAVELEQLTCQLDDLEAARPDRLPERRSALDPVPMMDEAELAEQRARRAEDEAERVRTRARQDEELRQVLLREKGIE